MPNRPTPRPFVDLGRYVRSVRERRGLTQIEVAKAAGMRNELVSRLEKGENVEIATYDLVARGLGCAGVLDLFTSGGDDEAAKLLRYWRSLGHPAARKDVLAVVKQIRDRSEG